MNRITKLGIACATTLALAGGTAQATAPERRTIVVWVHLNNSDQPTLVAKSMIHGVHNCVTKGNCLATMTGDSTLVFVRHSDFPGPHPHIGPALGPIHR